MKRKNKRQEVAKRGHKVTKQRFLKQKEQPIRIAIIGAGPIGCILGAYLARTKHQVVLVDILKPRLETIKKIGITVSGVVNFQTTIHDVTNRISNLKKFNPDYIFIAVKTSVLTSILRQVKLVMPKHAMVISFQNGLDVEHEISNVLGKNKVLRAVINYAGNLMVEGQIMMSFFNAPNYIGALSTESKPVAEKLVHILTTAGLTTKFVPDIRKYTWEKTILNASLAPVCALTRLTMKDAMELPETNKLVQNILKESIEVAKANGYDPGRKFFNNGLTYLQKAGPHKPSMLIDIESSNSTEIEFLNQKISDYGKMKKITTPYNDTLTQLIKGLEKLFTSSHQKPSKTTEEKNTE
ncbi:MAG: 2-dehydropantoate 2-reductase [Planctomycetota bacterium]